jgi:hypothetical protein
MTKLDKRIERLESPVDSSPKKPLSDTELAMRIHFLLAEAKRQGKPIPPILEPFRKLLDSD